MTSSSPPPRPPAASPRSGPADPSRPPEGARAAPRLADEDHAPVPTLGLSGPGGRRRLALIAVGLVALLAAIYVLLPQLVGFDDALSRVASADLAWVGVALAFNVAAFAAYVALFRGVLGGGSDPRVRARIGVRASYQITMAGLAATRLLSAAGAGGIAVTYWALRRAGMSRRAASCRMVAFLVLTYLVYLVSLLVFGLALRTGLLPGAAPFAGTVVPAALAAVVLVVIGLFALVPGDIERRLAGLAASHRRIGSLVRRLGGAPASVASGVRTAIAFARHPRRGALAIGGAVGFWAANIGVLWASFEAFDGHVAPAVLVQGFFFGMAANLLPSPTGGVGSVDAGMIGAFLLFGLPAAVVFPAVLLYRLIAFWLPIPPGLVAWVQLRRTVARWRAEDGGYTSESKVKLEATPEAT